MQNHGFLTFRNSWKGQGEKGGDGDGFLLQWNWAHLPHTKKMRLAFGKWLQPSWDKRLQKSSQDWAKAFLFGDQFLRKTGQK